MPEPPQDGFGEQNGEMPDQSVIMSPREF